MTITPLRSSFFSLYFSSFGTAEFPPCRKTRDEGGATGVVATLRSSPLKATSCLNGAPALEVSRREFLSVSGELGAGRDPSTAVDLCAWAQRSILAQDDSYSGVESSFRSGRRFRRRLLSGRRRCRLRESRSLRRRRRPRSGWQGSGPTLLA